MTTWYFKVPSYNNEMASKLTDLYDDGGYTAVFEYVKEHHPNWDWTYCSCCDQDTPIWSTEKDKICAVCFQYFNNPERN